jgi:tRNA(Ile)-lysidine synthase
MRPVRRLAPGVALIRPLLGQSRAALRDYLTDVGCTWREDPTNADPKFMRNRIRNELLPYLRTRFNIRFDRALLRLSEQACSATAYLDAMADERLSKVLANADRAEFVFSLNKLTALPPLERAIVFRRLFERFDWPRGRMGAVEWERLSSLADGGPTAVDFPDGVVARRSRGRLIVRRRQEPSGLPPVADAAHAPGSPDSEL